CDSLAVRLHFLDAATTRRTGEVGSKRNKNVARSVDHETLSVHGAAGSQNCMDDATGVDLPYRLCVSDIDVSGGVYRDVFRARQLRVRRSTPVTRVSIRAVARD